MGEIRTRSRTRRSDRMPVMRPPDFARFIRLLGTLLAWASLPVLIAFSWAPHTTVRASQAQKPSSAQAKTETKLDTSTLVVAADLAVQLAKFKPVLMPLDPSQLTLRERQLVGKLVEACQYLESIYWRQSDPEGLKLYHALAGSTSPRDVELRRFLGINGSRFDLIRNNAPFIGTSPLPPGRSIFPEDLTKEEFDRYVAAPSDKKAALYDPFTVIRRKGAELVAIPYQVAYRQWLDPAAKALRDAATLSD